jgi:hypothetical protein
VKLYTKLHKLLCGHRECNPEVFIEAKDFRPQLVEKRNLSMYFKSNAFFAMSYGFQNIKVPSVSAMRELLGHILLSFMLEIVIFFTVFIRFIS